MQRINSDGYPSDINTSTILNILKSSNEFVFSIFYVHFPIDSTPQIQEYFELSVYGGWWLSVWLE